MPLVLALVAVAAVLYLSYLFSRYLAVGATKINKSKYIKIIDRVVLGQERMIFIAMIGKKHYLIGSSSQSIHILKELEEADLSEEVAGSVKLPESNAFQNALKTFLTKKDRDHE